ncbi:DUF1361 domain-containing protein [Paenibacillus hodogayensis]|uniref:DUF1361 domain-containing protein n=1 Tax=Paenibacillus hodogayensis TaxID=279208 RepID=A0ABV5VYV4_9BACL
MERRLSRGALWTLAAASAVCALMIAARIGYTGRLTYYWLFMPNLLLAWIPLIASRLVGRSLNGKARPGAAAWAWGIVWLAFYPNASYIVTDLKHLAYLSTERSLYYDLSVNMLAALLGWLLGALSLLAIHAEVRERLGAAAGIAFAGIVIVLGSVGVYLGRVLRWNSWDLVVKPWRIVVDAADIVRDPQALLFVLAFSLFGGAAYAVLYRLLAPSGRFTST